MGFFSVAQGLAGLGRDIGVGADVVGKENEETKQNAIENRLKELQSQREQQRLDIEQGRFGLEKAQAGMPKLHSTFSTDDGTFYAVMLDPTSGQPFVRVLRQGTNQYPEFRSLQEMEAYAVEHKDQDLLSRAQAAIKATQREPADKPTTEVFDNFRWQYDPEKKLSGKRDPTGQYVQLGVAKEAAGGAEDKSIPDWADDISTGKVKFNEVPGKLRSGVVSYMRQHNISFPNAQKIRDAEAFLGTVKTLPSKPTPEQSQALAGSIDKLMGNSIKRQDLIDRGRRGTLMGLRSPYSPQAYDPAEYKANVDLLISLVNQMKAGTGLDQTNGQ